MIQTLFDFPVYFKFFIGLFALVNPVGIIPVFISMTSYQTAAARNKTNLTANLSVAIILLDRRFFWGTRFCRSSASRLIRSVSPAGILVVTIAMSMISGKLGEDETEQAGEIRDRGPREHRRGATGAAADGGAGGESARPSSGVRAITA